VNTVCEFFRGFFPIPKVEGHKVLNEVSTSTKRWISQKQTWKSISILAACAVLTTELDENMIFRLIGKSKEFENHLSLDFF
jgi:hypothetical protein